MLFRSIRLAVVEALYQGRYKAISVEHILDCWRRRGQPNFHFSLEFERLICQNLVTSATLADHSLANLPLQASVNIPQLPTLESQTVATPDLSSIAQESFSLPELEEASVAVVPESVISESLPNPLEVAGKEAESRRTIERFTPLLDNSELYAKLRAVAHRELASQQPLAVGSKKLI